MDSLPSIHGMGSCATEEEGGGTHAATHNHKHNQGGNFPSLFEIRFLRKLSEAKQMDARISISERDLFSTDSRTQKPQFVCFVFFFSPRETRRDQIEQRREISTLNKAVKSPGSKRLEPNARKRRAEKKTRSFAGKEGAKRMGFARGREGMDTQRDRVCGGGGGDGGRRRDPRGGGGGRGVIQSKWRWMGEMGDS